MRRCVAALSAMSLLALGACGSGEDRRDEKAVCASFQKMVEHLRTERPRDALAEMRELQRLTAATDNRVISDSGREFSQGIDKKVSDAEVTPDQAIQEGRQALQVGGAALNRIVKECKRLGFEIDLPQYDAEGKRIPGT